MVCHILFEIISFDEKWAKRIPSNLLPKFAPCSRKLVNNQHPLATVAMAAFCPPPALQKKAEVQLVQPEVNAMNSEAVASMALLECNTTSAVPLKGEGVNRTSSEQVNEVNKEDSSGIFLEM
jgi:hypothetical protein